MTVYRKPAYFLVSAMFLALPLVSSAQISTGTEYRQAYDEARDSFGEDYGSQRDAAAERNNVRTISKNVGSYISNAMKAMQKPDYDKAVVQIDKGFAVHGLTDYEKSVLYQLRAAATLKQGDYNGAIDSYEKAIKTGGMTDTEIQTVQSNIAKMRKTTG